jgi:oligosaccharide 4-alpha-D-glucosyltransferase
LIQLENLTVTIFFFGNTGLIDVFDPKARSWFWNIYKKFANQGVEGWWGDLGEPEVHPADIIHINGTGDEVHNAYGHEWARIIFDGYKNDFPEKRPFILMRAGYAGSQRYGMITWTGDVSRSFDGLIPQPEISLQMGMQGIAYMHSDLGGFAGGDSLDNDLYTRWLQYGVFQPIYRPHAHEAIAPEPVFQNEKTKALVKKSIELRYRLKPYIYNMAFENSTYGKPLMIPLFFNEAENEMLLTYDKAYMWGDAFLVSPVKERGKKEQKIYFPKGTNWTDFYSGKAYNGGKEYTISLTMEHIPVFVKGGAFIPMVKEAVNEMNYTLNEYEIHYFADNQVKESYYKLFNDDGKTTHTLASGDYEFMTYWAENVDASLKITLQKTGASDAYEAITNHVTLKVHNLLKAPKQIKINGKKLKNSEWSWDKRNKLLEVKAACSVKKEVVEIIR